MLLLFAGEILIILLHHHHHHYRSQSSQYGSIKNVLKLHRKEARKTEKNILE
jgi:hypothetical protein